MLTISVPALNVVVFRSKMLAEIPVGQEDSL